MFSSMTARALALVCALMVSAGAPATATSTVATRLQFEFVMNIGSEGVGAGEFKYVEDFAFTRDGHLIVTDGAHACVQLFDRRTGAFIHRFGGKGGKDHHLEKPEGIAVGPDGHIYVGDYNTGYVKRYDAQYRWVATYAGYGSDLGQTMMSEFMDIRNGRLYVPDVGNHRVNVFSLDGEGLFHFGGHGRDAGRFDTPESAKINSRGQLFVADLGNDRIQVFDLDGNHAFTFGTSGDDLGELDAPAGIAFDRHDNVYVTEIGNARVHVFDPAGRPLVTWGGPGSANGRFANPHGIIVDTDTGWVYVADTGNHRIQVFRPVTRRRGPA